MYYKYKLMEDDNDTFLITSPDFPEVTSFAESEDDAVLNAKNAIEEAICARISKKLEVPKPHSTIKGKGIKLSLIVVLKIALYNEVLRTGSKRNTFGKSIGLQATQVDRLFDIRYNSKLDIIEYALDALNLEPEISFSKREA